MARQSYNQNIYANCYGPPGLPPKYLRHLLWPARATTEISMLIVMARQGYHQNIYDKCYGPPRLPPKYLC